MEIVDRIDAARIAKGLSKDALEREAGLSTGRLCKWVKGTGAPTVSQVLAIARALEISPAQLVGGSTTKDNGGGEDLEFLLQIVAKLGMEAAMDRLIYPSIVKPRKRRKANARPRSRDDGAATAAPSGTSAAVMATRPS